MKTNTLPTAYAVLDTYAADLLNETPARREEITEIQDREQGDLLCYANPAHAARLVSLANLPTCAEVSDARAVLELATKGKTLTGDAARLALRLGALLARIEGETTLTTIDPDDAKQHGETERGQWFDRVTVRAPFSGPFDAAAIFAAVSPDYEGCLHRPVSIDRASVCEVEPGIAQWVRVLSLGD